MIAYDLRCSMAHGFEGWFASSRDYDAQIAAGLLRCPVCEDVGISKQITAPNVGRKSNQIAQSPTANTQSNIQLNSESVSEQPTKSEEVCPPSFTSHSNVPSLADGQGAAGQGPAAMSEMIAKLAKLQNEVLKESRWVGRKFADEARAMHYGEAKSQQIHGEASPQEAKTLADEGIAIAALPLPFIPPEAKN